MKFRRGNLGFFTLQGCFMATYCTIFGFTVTILLEYGFSSGFCGIITMLQCVVLMLIQPVYGYLVDHFISPKKGFIAIISIGTVLAIPLAAVFRMSATVVVVYMTLLSMFTFSAGALLDHWCVDVINKTRGMDYAIVRGGGSIFYAFTALLAGNLIAPLGVESLFVLHIILGVVTIGVSCLLVDPEKMDSSRAQHRSSEKNVSMGKAAVILLKNHDYRIFLICMCLFNFATRSTSTYLPMALQNVGGTSLHFGIAVFISAFFEAVVMLFVTRLIMHGLPLTYSLIIGFVILTVRMLLLGLIPSLWGLVLTQFVQALGFGFYLRAYAEHTVHIVPDGYHGMALMLMSAISNGVGSVIGSLMGGELIDLIGVNYYNFLCAGMMFGAALIFLPTVIKEYNYRRDIKHSHLIAMHQLALQHQAIDVVENSQETISSTEDQ